MPNQQRREDYICWEDYFMGLALLSAKRSKDPETQVGACIVNENNRIVGMGYNGFPDGCHDNDFPWGKNNDDPLENKSMYVCHAEMNAIVNRFTADLRNCTVYTTLFPCNECAKIIVQAGIRTIVFLSDKNKAPFIAARRIFTSAGVRFVRFEPRDHRIELDLTPSDGEGARNN